MKILYITQTLPYPLNTGGKIRNSSIINILQKLGHEITLCSFISEENDFKYIEELRKNNIHIGKIITNPNLSLNRKAKQTIQKILKYFFNLFSLFPFTVRKFQSKDIKIFIHNYIQKNKVDCIWISYLSMAQYLPQNYQHLKILDLHDIDSILFNRMFMNDSSIKWKLFALTEWIKFHFFEKQVIPKFDRIITICETDKELLSEAVSIISGKTLAIPPIIKPKKIYPINKDINNLLFVGNLYWYPHKDGMKWFLNDIYPKIIKEVPYIEIDIVGKLPPDLIFPKYPNIYYFGNKKNIDTFWRKPSIFITPARYGTGLQYKILEAMSWGLPVISTVQGAKGLGRNISDGQNILLAKDEKEFAEKIIILLQNSNLRRKLVRESYKLLMKYYSEEKVTRLIGSALEKK